MRRQAGAEYKPPGPRVGRTTEKAPEKATEKGAPVGRSDSLGTDARELVDLVVAYARQETVDPLKGLGKSVAFGVAGALLVAVGSVFLALAALRALQTETDVFDGNLSWVPYLVLTVCLAAGAGVTWKALGPARKEEAR